MTEKSLPDAPIRLIEATIRVLATRGPSEVKARSISTEAGLSTMGVYTHFGGVPELLHAVADEGFKRLAAAFKRLPVTDDAISDSCAILLACRDLAKSNPHLYDLMFGLSIDGRYSPSRGTMTSIAGGQSEAFKATYAIVIQTCARLVDEKCVHKVDPALIAPQLWSAAHGFIMLELAGHFAGIAKPAEEILVATCNNIVVGFGANRQIVESSTAGVLARWVSSPMA